MSSTKAAVSAEPVQAAPPVTVTAVSMPVKHDGILRAIGERFEAPLKDMQNLISHGIVALVHDIEGKKNK